MQLIYLFMCAFLITLFIVPVIIKLAYKTNFIDVPNERKIHKKPKAYLGGLAIYLSTFVTFLLGNEFYLSKTDKIIWELGFVVLLIGLFDDRTNMKARYKALGQIVVSVIAALLLDDVTSLNIFGHYVTLTKFEATLIQALWIFAVMNSFNLIDGLDGLASGLGLISLLFLAIIMFTQGDTSSMIYVVIMIGALLGFLYYNFYPSDIFLGDAGSMFIGFYISVISFGGYKTATLTTISVLILVAAIPILDIILAIVRRKKNKKKIFSADALHFHHRLTRHGYSITKSVLIMYSIMIIYGIEALILSFAQSKEVIYISIIIIFIITWLIVEYFYMLSDKFTIIRKTINKIKKRNDTNDR